uniref:Tetratricopeptide repeat protein n=1 Tax=Eubacterium plexicaudatum ASF492 TaxID=1235802 RepID=N2A4P2_9FIRM
MRNLNSKLVMDFISEQGYDSIEKTYVAYTPLEKYVCIAVAESYDNETEENSAQLAVEAVLTAFEKKPSLKRLPEYIRYANEQILLHSTRSQLKVSITVLVSDYTRMRYAYCGNTRLYILYENIFTHISRTQTKFQQQLEADGEQPPELEEIHNLTEYLGREKRVRPFVSKTMELTEGSTILFATSNLWGRLSEIEILDAYEYTKTGKEFLEILQELLLSLQEEHDQRMGSFTAAFLYIEKTFKEDIQKKKKRKRMILMVIVILAVILIIISIVILCIRALDRKKIKEVETCDKRGTRYMNYTNYNKALTEYEQAVEKAEGLSLNNWQYIEEKRELLETVTDREAILTLYQEAEAAYQAGEYEQALKLYTQIQKEAVYQGFDTLSADAKKKTEEITVRMQIMQYISLGDMYQSTEDYDEALFQYNRALSELSKMIDLQMQGDVQAKIFAIRQTQKENAQAAQEAQQEAQQQKEEEEAAQKAAAADKAVIKINTYIANANSALEEGRTRRARELYKQALSRYNKFTGSGEDADKLYKDITALGQAITEAEVKAVEEAQEEQLAQAAKYVLQAKEAARGGDIGIAKQLYEDALAVYRELNIWDERMEAVYDAMDALTQGSGQNPGEVQGGSQNGAQQNAAQNAGDGQQSTAQDAGDQDTQAKG